MRDDAPGVYMTTGKAPEADCCPYCQQYEWCDGCPIAEKTHDVECYGTPYRRAANAWNEYHNSGWDEKYREEWKWAADEMVEFLETLPDEDE